MSTLRVFSPVLLGCVLSVTACVRAPVQPDEAPVPPAMQPQPSSASTSEFVEPVGAPPSTAAPADEPSRSASMASAAGAGGTASVGMIEGSVASAEPPPPIPSFGAGAELARREETASPMMAPGSVPPGAPPPSAPVEGAAPSFGAGAELYRAGEGERLPVPERPRPPRLEGDALEPITPPVALAVPVPPPARSDALTLSTYQLQTEVYGLQTALMGRPLLPRMIVRIDAMALQSQNLPDLALGKPRHQQVAQEVRAELQKLQGAARLRDRETVDLTLVRLQALLMRLRAA